MSRSSSSSSSEESYSETESEYNEDDVKAKTANCIRNVANFSKVKSFHLMEKGDFDPEVLNIYLKEASPKLVKLFEQIKALDEKDLQEHGTLYKHMIFTDVKSSSYGAKIIASAFSAQGYKPAFHIQGPGFALYPEETLLETKSNNFGVLISKSFFDRSMNVRFKKSLLQLYNDRPHNINGDLVRFIILDQGFKEGIDLYDVKYIHLFEPLLVKADEKQAIGRGTRFCGQLGLTFNPQYGWPLYVYKYEATIPEHLQQQFKDSKNIFELYLQYADIDLRKVVFAAELERLASQSAVDYSLTYPVHEFSIEKPPGRLEGGAELRKRVPKPPPTIMNYKAMQSYIQRYYKQFQYPEVTLENKCTSGGAPQLIQFTPTQDFVRHFFQPSSAYKGILFWHTVGVGKTCSAIATATTSFEKEGYTILWVTRHTLKSDIWKNMYKQVCSLVIQDQLKAGTLKLPEKVGSPMKYVSDRWMEPISYKQFSNLLLQKNKYYEQMVTRNGKDDPLRKTLLIIDEAHKLYSPTVQGSEKPDTDILEKMIQHSYEKSGKDSVRIITMTGTPYTEDGMEMIKLINLLKEKSDHLPTEFDAFSKAYLDENGYFTTKGSAKLLNDLSGYISYVNRSQDARNFAYPVMEEVTVPITEHVLTEEENKIKKTKEDIKAVKRQLREAKKGAKLKEKGCKELEKTSLKEKEAMAKSDKDADIEKCKELPVKERKPCKEAAAIKYEEALELNKEQAAEEFTDCMNKADDNEELLTKLEDQLNALQAIVETSRDTKKSITATVKELRAEMKEEKGTLKDLKEELIQQRNVIKRIKDKDARKKETKRVRESFGKEFKAQKKVVLALRNKIVSLTLDKKKMLLKEGAKPLEDVSQTTMLQTKCSIY